MAAVPARPSGSRARHRKRFSLSRLSSDTTATLPEYRQATAPVWNTTVPDDEPPDYPDSADEADEETDEYLPLSPSLSPRRRRLTARLTTKRGLPYHGVASQSDTFLDSLLERSVNALELSNALLHSSMTAQSSLSSVLDVDQSPDRMLDVRARDLSRRIRKNKNVQERWMVDLDDLARDVEELMDDGPVSHSLPSSSPLARRQRKERKIPIMGSRQARMDAGHLVSNAVARNLSSPPPRALTQYVSIRAEQGDVLEETSDPSHIFLPSTIGLRSSSHVSDLSSSSLNQPSSSPESSPITSSLVRRHSASPSPHFTRTRPSRSPTPTCRPQSRSRSQSWSSNKVAHSPKLLPRIMPPPIEELPSQSDSSASDSPQPFRTVEQLRKILVEQSPPPKEPSPSRSSARQAPSFSPRSPPVTSITSTSTTTTSISRLYTKGSHSTTTRAPSPPRMSSLKKRPSPLSSAGPSTLNLPEFSNGSISPSPSSGRSTPRNVVFGPLPEPHRERPPSGGLTRFQEQKEAKSRARRRRNGDLKKEKGEKEKEGESSWWTTWLMGGSSLTMSSSRQEERAEERIARWSRPGMGVGLEDWPV